MQSYYTMLHKFHLQYNISGRITCTAHRWPIPTARSIVCICEWAHVQPCKNGWTDRDAVRGEGRLVSAQELCIGWGDQWRHLANRTEWSVGVGDATLCRMTDYLFNSVLAHSLKAIRNFPYPLRWNGGSVIIHARLLPSSESFSW